MYGELSLSKEYLGYKSIQFGKMFIWIVTSILLIILLCMFVFEIDVVLKGQGIVRPNKYISEIKNVYSGSLSNINYFNEKEVEKGDILYTINNFNSLNNKKTTELELIKLKKEEKGIEIFLSSLKDNMSKFEKKDYYYNAFLEYQLNLKKLDLNLLEAEKSCFEKKNLGNKYISEKSLNDSKRNYELAKINREQHIIENKVFYGNKLKEVQDKIQLLSKNIEKIEEEIKLSNVTSPINGIVQIEKKVNVGDFVNSGEVLLRVVPKDYDIKMDIYIENKDIAKAKINQEIKYRINPLPYKEFGMSRGKVKSISKDSNYNQDGRYLVEGSIEITKLSNRQGHEEEIPIGALADIRIVVKRKKIIWYVLEKLDFINEG